MSPIDISIRDSVNDSRFRGKYIVIMKDETAEMNASSTAVMLTVTWNCNVALESGREEHEEKRGQKAHAA